ncbi:MAG: histidine phosphatase family protein [Hyphomicrobiaceae bacterium]|nr:histidine phosphatase family protein [Hyphomicrobiaceae bacterium]
MAHTIRRIILLRHGEVAYFDTSGRATDPWQAPLTDRGRSQAEAAASAIAESGVDRLVTSAVPRAIETATILSNRLGMLAHRDEVWNEARPGDLNIVSEDAVDSVILDTFRLAAEPGARFLGGEPFVELATRVQRGIDGLLVATDWTTLVLVTHDPVIRLVISTTLGLGLRGMRYFEQDPGCLTIIDWAENRDGVAEPILRLINASPDDLAKGGSREPALVRFHRSYCASRVKR